MWLKNDQYYILTIFAITSHPNGGSAKAEDREGNGCHQHSSMRLIKGDQAEWLSELVANAPWGMLLLHGWL